MLLPNTAHFDVTGSLPRFDPLLNLKFSAQCYRLEFEDIEVSLDKLPIKNLKAIEENRLELMVSYELQEKSSKDTQWQSMVENLQLVHQELSIIIDLLNTIDEE
ncbi:hypothetical protein L6164_011377 [Bauhinia variegata]|uniref:Uncharacterized protein n=1 Tax=Bauhinia variegata TaxID=167791 RepID=A0ACB9P8B1_BAUVA|nr:hypothetical protein L6164_011377 [Bauhinia variegata]